VQSLRSGCFGVFLKAEAEISPEKEKGPTCVGPVTDQYLRETRSRRPRGAGGWGIRYRKDRANAGDSYRKLARRAVGRSGAVLWFS